MDEIAKLLGYALLAVGGVIIVSKAPHVVGEYYRTAGGRGILAFILGLGGFVWMGYVLAHKEEIGSAGLLLGLLVIWGPMLFLAASMGPRASSATQTRQQSGATSILTLDQADAIVAGMSEYIEHRQGRYGRASDLRQLGHTEALIEMAFMKALREWPEGDRLDGLRALYLSLDQWLLSDEECELLTEYRAAINYGREPGRAPEMAAWMASERGRKASALLQEVLAKTGERQNVVHIERPRAGRA